MKKLIVVALVVAFSSFVFAQKTKSLFNGENLEGWGFVLDPANPADAKDVFSVKDGVISIKGKPFGYMFTKEKFSDFTLYVEWRWPQKPTNSGIFLFVQDEAFWPNCVETQLCNGSAGDFILMNGADMKEFKIPEGKARPKFPVMKRFEKSSEKPAGEWNTAVIHCKNGVVNVFINGVFQNKGTLTMNKSGSIALQSEGEEIQFRNVCITPCE